MANRDILTIGEAGAALSLSGPRIHQLLAEGELDGPSLPLGRRRHSPGAPRVTRVSIDKYLHARVGGRTENVPLALPPPACSSASDSGVSASGEASAAQEMKLKLDVMREELAAERARNRELLEVVEKLIGILRASQASADRLDSVTDGYSDALTQVLAPDAPA